MNKVEHWNGQIENTQIEYTQEKNNELMIESSKICLSSNYGANYNKADKTDYIVAASCGILTGLLDSFWVGEFNLSSAQNWGRDKVSNFVIKVAQIRGFRKKDLEGAIRFLEIEAPIPSDQLTPIWGGGLQHHFRDFAHHASLVGLVFSILTQFTEKSYGTNTEGIFEIRELPNHELIGKTFEEKIYNGTIIWGLHLVSDMAGSSNTAGKGTGIPGPLLSLAKELSVLPKIREIQLYYKDDKISLSVMLSKIFNGTAFDHTSREDLTRFDLRTELGLYAYGVKQSIPIVINQCVVRAFYFIKRLAIEISTLQIKGIKDISKLEPEHFQPWNNECIIRMLTISSGVFCVVDASDAAIRAFITAPQNRLDYVTQFLLHTNFTGIGNFIVSIKNDISLSLLGERKSPYGETMLIDNNETSLSAENISIDIAVDIDNTGIYKYAFYRMYNHVKENKDRFTENQKTIIGMERQIIRLEDDETDLFDRVASISVHSLMVETEELIKRLFTLYGVEYYPFSDNDAKYRFYMPFYRIENGKKTGYLLSRSMMQRIEWELIRDKYKIDGIKAVALVELGNNSEIRDFFVGEEIRKSRGFVQYMPLKDLFSLISEKEYDVYMTYAQKYNSDIKKLIGYRTIVVPSADAVEKLKISTEKELRSMGFDHILYRDGLYKNQIKIIKNNFWRRGLYKALLGESSFAESFISSEWYYKNHIEFSILEHTAIIAGYLKSVEQLLFSIVKLSEGSGKQIKKRGGARAEYIDYSSENEALIDSTLGSIIGYVRHYSDLWDVSPYVKNYIANKLDVFRDKYRNDHFHKDNVTNIDEIEEIRTNTILIHYLLLGAMKINDSDKARLGIITKEKEEKKKMDLSYSMLEEWLNRIVGGDVLLPTSSNLYFEIGTGGYEQWNLKFMTVKGFDEHGIPQGTEWPYLGDELIWDRVLEKDAMIEKVISLINEYLTRGLYAVNLKRYSMISAGWFGDPRILYKR